MAPRSPSIGSRSSMPFADLAMQRNVPPRLIWMIMLKNSSGKCLVSPVCLSRLAVLMALPVPAQLTRIRSWPCASRALAKAASTSSSLVTLHLQKTPPTSLATASPLSAFRPKIRRVAALVPFAGEALSLWYCAKDEETPLAAKGMMFAALAYFVLPTDVVPDFIAGLGYTDDAAVLMAALGLVGRHVKPRH